MADHDSPDGPGAQVAAGLAKLGLVLRHQAWQASGQRGLTPTQSQILELIADLGPGVSVSTVGQRLSITKGTASEAISTLERKVLLRKEADPSDGRVVLLKLTPNGRREAKRSTGRPAVVVESVDTLSSAEQAGFLRGLIGLIGSLQDKGEISTSRMCAECRFFRPNHYSGKPKPHHCGFLDAAIADSDLRIDCAEMEPAPLDRRPELLRSLSSGTQLTPQNPSDKDGPA